MQCFGKQPIHSENLLLLKQFPIACFKRWSTNTAIWYILEFSSSTNLIYLYATRILIMNFNWVKWCTEGNSFWNKAIFNGLIYRKCLKSGTHYSWKNEIWGNCGCSNATGCCCTAIAVMSSSFSGFYNSFPASLAIPCSFSSQQKPLKLPARKGREEDFWHSWQDSHEKTQWGSQQEITPAHTSFLPILGHSVSLFKKGNNVSLKWWPNGVLVTPILIDNN